MTNSENDGDDFDRVFASIKAKMSFFGRGAFIMQQNGARAHTGKRNLEKINDLGQEGGWNIEVVTQLFQHQ